MSRGAILLSRHVADHGQMNWPKCAHCGRQVDAYGIENETAGHIEIWARCSGITQGRRVHQVKRDSVFFLKGATWSPNTFTDWVRRQAFFHHNGDRHWQQMPTVHGARPR
jgi:hypothetical protein